MISQFVCHFNAEAQRRKVRRDIRFSIEMMNYINQFTIMNFHYLLRAKIGVNKAIALQKLRKNSAYSAPLR